MTDDAAALRAENERLRARVQELERQLGEQAASANAAIAAAQDRVYWLDRARIDPDRLMAGPAGRVVRALARLRRRRP
jgi:cell division septum initiation protein DivIVA